MWGLLGLPLCSPLCSCTPFTGFHGLASPSVYTPAPARRHPIMCLPWTHTHRHTYTGTHIQAHGHTIPLGVSGFLAGRGFYCVCVRLVIHQPLGLSYPSCPPLPPSLLASGFMLWAGLCPFFLTMFPIPSWVVRSPPPGGKRAKNIGRGTSSPPSNP